MCPSIPPSPPTFPPPDCFLNNRTAVDLLSYQHNFVSFDKAFYWTLPPNTNVINKVTGQRNDDDPVYIKQIIGFVQCLMIAECICAYVYFNYSKTKKVHIHSKKRLAFFCRYRGIFNSVTLYVLFGSQYLHTWV